MPRHISSVLDIQKGAEKWTVLAQVVHKGHSQLTREVPPRRIMRFLLTDAEVSNSFLSLWSLIKFIDENILDSVYEHFMICFFITTWLKTC